MWFFLGAIKLNFKIKTRRLWMVSVGGKNIDIKEKRKVSSTSKQSGAY